MTAEAGSYREAPGRGSEGLRFPLSPEPLAQWLEVRSLRTFALFLFAISFFSSPVSGQDSSTSLGEFNLNLTGDSIITTPAKVRQSDSRFMAIVEAIRRADAAFTNLELTFPGPNTYPAGLPRAGVIASDPAMLKELQWIGFSLFGAANNHSLDYGIQGLLDTMQVLKRDGAVYAGIGENLGQAREPAYLSTPHGRVALITCASTFQADSPAGQARPDMRGRPGLNPLRHDTRYRVDAATFAALRKMKSDLHLTGPAGSGSPETLGFSFPASSIYPLTVTFELSDKPGVVTTPDPRDLAALTHSIRDAREFSDYVVVSIHAHEGMPGADPLEVPAQFLVEFAHAAVDAGADVFVASGPHVLRGIEIYKGKPIFYSLGNFIFENWLVVPEPTEYYERFGLGLEALPSEAYEARSDHGRRDEPANPLYWQSVVAHVVFHDGHPEGITLTPFTLGFGKRAPDRGYPELADPAAAAEILGRLEKLSRPFGTSITVRNGVASITIQ
jgi:poly-gamma-glutamate capsule biosynthesis protein CapA/YwtB (metallophosphatase superfamily)